MTPNTSNCHRQLREHMDYANFFKFSKQFIKKSTNSNLEIPIYRYLWLGYITIKIPFVLKYERATFPLPSPDSSN